MLITHDRIARVAAVLGNHSHQAARLTATTVRAIEDLFASEHISHVDMTLRFSPREANTALHMVELHTCSRSRCCSPFATFHTRTSTRASEVARVLRGSVGIRVVPEQDIEEVATSDASLRRLGKSASEALAGVVDLMKGTAVEPQVAAFAHNVCEWYREAVVLKWAFQFAYRSPESREEVVVHWCDDENCEIPAARASRLFSGMLRTDGYHALHPAFSI
jgi:hypothetical protein